MRAAVTAFAKVTAVVVGGETRTDSVRNGLDALPPDTEIVLVHDAARPLITADVIDRVLAATAQTGAAVPGLPLSDTVKRVDARGTVRATIPRAMTPIIHRPTPNAQRLTPNAVITGLTAVQTPQGARVALLRAAYAHFDFAHDEPTDEASLLEAMGASVAVVPGDPANIKITRPEDLALAERLIHGMEPGSPQTEAESALASSVSSTLTPEIRTGFGYDVHAFAASEAGRRLFLGGVEIPHDRGLDGHSDADVLLHAVCDALLGAVSLGDIGLLFPNTDNAYKDISSLRLLANVGQRLTEAGWEVVNIDATVLAEAPRLMPHREAMQRAMAACLGLAPACISVKATTSEKLGFVGRGEGISCWAVATVRRPNHPSTPRT